MRLAEWQRLGGCEKKSRAVHFSLASCARYAYKDCTEAMTPGFEELAR